MSRPHPEPVETPLTMEELAAFLDLLEAEASAALASPVPARWYVCFPAPEPFVAAETSNRMLAGTITSTLDGVTLLSRQELAQEETYRAALTAWEARDDHVYQEVRRRWALWIPGFVADRRAQLRWGMIRPSAGA
jgi:hypothetical protein